ncbi:MAG TPA: A/G-specific adenine glycosylase [Phycisphaerae bacterium]|nr:A/G-specific adenine glycosylase [Phycisphaerae bacterium]
MRPSAAALPMHSLDRRKINPIRRRLLAWFDHEKRDMPWRSTRDPYAIWLSETMLQQTQVATVIPYYERFLDRFPTVHDLASAKIDEVLHLWSGLGYYARARNLHRAAQAVVEEFEGAFPQTPSELRELPGVGAYTAGAVASIAFGRRAAAVDGNVIRVLSRLFNIASDVSRNDVRASIQTRAEQLIPLDRPGDFNQALMELGATVCLPKDAARCPTCPLRPYCAAATAGTVGALPKKSPKAVAKTETHLVAAVERDGRWLFVRRPANGLWGGLWELPSQPANGDRSGRSLSTTIRSFVTAHLDDATSIEIVPRPFCDISHQLTHKTIRFIGHACRIREKRIGRISKASRGCGSTAGRAAASRNWLPVEESGTLGLSTAMKKVLEALKVARADKAI